MYPLSIREPPREIVFTLVKSPRERNKRISLGDIGLVHHFGARGGRGGYLPDGLVQS